MLAPGMIAWAKEVACTDQDLTQHSGLDAFLFVRFLGGMALWLAVASLIVCPVLLPLNVIYSRSQSSGGLNRLKWPGSASSGTYLSCHTVVIAVASGLFCWVVRSEWHQTLARRDDAIWSPVNRGQHAVVVRRQDESVAWKLYDQCKRRPKVLDPAFQAPAAQARQRFEQARNQLERHLANVAARAVQRDEDGYLAYLQDAPSPSWWRRAVDSLLRRPRADILKQCAESVREALEQLTPEPRLSHAPRGETVVLQFPDPLSAAFAANTIQPSCGVGRPIWCHVDDIDWTNVSASPQTDDRRRWLSRLALVGLICLWTVPIAFAGSLSQLFALSSYVASVQWLDKLPPSAIGVIQASLPSLVTTLLLALFQPVLRWCIAFRQCISRCHQDLAVQRYHFAFLYVHLFLTVSIASGLTAAMFQILKNPNATARLLADNLPKASNFFLVFIVLRMLGDVGSTLMHIPHLATHFIGHWRAASPRDLEQVQHSRDIRDWGTVVSIHTTLAAIGKRRQVAAGWTSC